jgi:hypothetical protein
LLSGENGLAAVDDVARKPVPSLGKENKLDESHPAPDWVSALLHMLNSRRLSGLERGAILGGGDGSNAFPIISVENIDVYVSA